MSHQAAFAAALLDPQLPCPDGLCSANGADPASRFSVYRNNVQSSLINALADSYPVVQQLVGEDFFRAMAAVFVQQHPPETPLMSRYGEALPAFLDDLRSHVWLDGGRLAVAHAGLKEDMIGRGSGAVREFALYGETTGEVDEFGLPVRADWAAAYRGKTAVV